MAAPWTDEMEARLRVLVASRLSMSQCAKVLSEEFGVTLSRNACIGKAHRRGIEQPKVRKAAAQPRRRAPRPEPSPPRPLAQPVILPAAAPEPEPEPVAAHASPGVTIFELLPCSCRWPLGPLKAKAEFFCGGPAMPDKPYCAEHAKRAGTGILARSKPKRPGSHIIMRPGDRRLAALVAAE